MALTLLPDDNAQLVRTIEKSKKPQRNKAIIVGLGFILLLTSPTLDQFFMWSSNFKSTEKRILRPMPAFTFPHVQTFIAQFSLYYKENFGWRNALFYQYSQWKYNILAVSPLPAKVVIGKSNKDGWFYPGNSLNQAADQHRGLRPIHPDTLALIGRKLTSLQHQLKEQGATLYVLVAPDSYTVYPENLPAYFSPKTITSNFDRFKLHMAQHTTVPVVDVRQALIDGKTNYDTYYHTDTHWNEYGSLLATLTFVERAKQNFPAIPVPRQSDYHIATQKGASGDLVLMLALNHSITDSVDYKIKPVDFLYSRNTVIEPVENALPSQRFVTAYSDRPKLLLVGDSFSFAMNQSIPGYFRESYLIRGLSSTFDMKLAKTEHPDIVLIEIVERNIDWLRLL